MGRRPGAFGNDDIHRSAISSSHDRLSEKEKRMLAQHDGQAQKESIRDATHTRKVFGFISSLLLVISLVFLILVNIGSVRPTGALAGIYFLKIDVSNIVPQSIPGSVLLNTIAQTLGLHDFYQTGLWNFCEGYVGEGITRCSDPEPLYWFNPVEILLDELLFGASIALPADLIDVLDTLNVVTNWMFGLFLFGTATTFVLIFAAPLVLFSRWISLIIGALAVVNAIAVIVASVIATVMFVIFRNVITQVTELNISAEIGVKMFAFMWIASGFALLAAIFQAGMCCCCTSRRSASKQRKTA